MILAQLTDPDLIVPTAGFFDSPLNVLLLIFFTTVGACIGSFLNVVIYRLPAGQSVISPPSHCPHCGYRLSWFDNIPVLAWIVLRGKCRKCGTPISIQYPMVEALCGLLFGGLFLLCYAGQMRPDFAGPGLDATWPIYLVYLVMLSGVFAAVAIDARHYIIPVHLMWLIAAVAIVALPIVAAVLPGSTATVVLPPSDLHPSVRLHNVQPAIYQHSTAVQLTIQSYAEGPVRVTALPVATGQWIGAVLLAAVGLVLSNIALATGLLPYSFIVDEPEEDAEDPEAFLTHPHPRREVLKELGFVLPPVIGAVVGYAVFGSMFDDAPVWLEVLAGTLLGFMVGGAVVWATRIFGTLGFGKEAMGLGDVHLMAAIGAVVGWKAATLAFFVAPFLGLTYALVGFGAGQLLKREVRVIPYGPHLAMGAMIVVVFHEPLLGRVLMLFGV